jgi:1,6-anhydro-N-acetylmuramate kinase
MLIGSMSGTSLDGLDLVCVDFKKKKNWDFEILKPKPIRIHQNGKPVCQNYISKILNKSKRSRKTTSIYWQNLF